MPKLITRVVNIRYQQFDVYCGRNSQGIVPKNVDEYGAFGNPYNTENRTRDEAIDLFREYFYDRLKQDRKFKKAIRDLAGLRLGCFCKPRKCHCDVIAEYLNQ